MANKNFKARIGIEAPLIAADNGTTAITLTGANVAVAGTLDVQGGTITDSTGALQITTASNGNITLTPDGTGTVIVSSDLAVNGATSADITTTTTTASVFNTTATTLNIGGAATTAVNIGTANGSILKGSNRSPFTSPTITAFTGTVAPSRGLLMNNGNGASAALARNTLLLRTYPTTGSSRGQLIFENARGTENVPTAVVSGDLMAEINATGYATNGFISDYIASIPALSYFTPTETWANTGGPYPTAGTVTNAGCGYIISLQPTATNLSASSRVTVLNINPQTFACRSDSYTWSNGKTGTTQRMSLDVNGNLTVSNKLSTSGSTFDNELAVDAQSNLLDTNTVSGTSVAIQTNYWTSSAKTTRTVPQSGNKLGNFRFNSYSDTAGTFALGSQVSTEATENWTSTANGSKLIFLANKQGESWTTGHVQVASFQPESSAFSSDVFTIESSAGNNYLVLDGSTATLTNTAGNPLPGDNISYGRQYIEAYSTVDQTNPTANAENLMAFENTGISNGISIVTNGTTLTRITMSNAGIYNIQFSAQLSQTSGGSANSFIWLKKNGTAVANTAGDTRVAGNGDRIMAAWNYVVSAAAGDYYELAWSAQDTSVILDYSAASAPVPAVPSVILTVVPVGA